MKDAQLKINLAECEDLDFRQYFKQEPKVCSKIPTGHYEENTLIWVTGIKRFYVRKGKNWHEVVPPPPTPVDIINKNRSAPQGNALFSSTNNVSMGTPITGPTTLERIRYRLNR